MRTIGSHEYQSDAGFHMRRPTRANYEIRPDVSKVRHMNTTVFPLAKRAALAKARKSLILGITLGIVAPLGALAFGFWSFRSGTGIDPIATTLNAPAPAAAPPTANTSQDPKAEVVLLVLTPKGFDKTMITHPKGKFLLVVESRLGLKEPSLNLSRLVGNHSKDKLKDGDIKKEQRYWSEELDLNP